MLQLFEREWGGRAVRLIGVGVSGFRSPALQKTLWEQPSEPNERDARLAAAMDALRARFGAGAIRRASDLDDE